MRLLRSWVSPPADGSRSRERSHIGDTVRNRHHAGCCAADVRVGDRYTPSLKSPQCLPLPPWPAKVSPPDRPPSAFPSARACGPRLKMISTANQRGPSTSGAHRSPTPPARRTSAEPAIPNGHAEPSRAALGARDWVLPGGSWPPPVTLRGRRRCQSSKRDQSIPHTSAALLAIAYGPTGAGLRPVAVAFWVQVMGAANGTSGTRLGPQEARTSGRRRFVSTRPDPSFGASRKAAKSARVVVLTRAAHPAFRTSLQLSQDRPGRGGAQIRPREVGGTGEASGDGRS